MGICHGCPFWLPAFCFCLSMSLLVLCDKSDEGGHGPAEPLQKPREGSPRRLRSRPRDFQSECVAGYRGRIEFHCQFPGTEQPCLRDYAEDSVRQSTVVATECCTSVRSCSVVDEIESLCCRTMDCLALCYGQPFIDRIQRRFRYADILIKRHASKKDGE